MISIIICWVNPGMLAALEENIAVTILTEYEIIAVDNRANDHSLAGAYNLGAFKAKFDVLCFIHQDILFHTQGWGNNLIKHFDTPSVALVGVLGNMVKTRCPSNVFMFNSDLIAINHLQKDESGNNQLYYQKPVSESVVDVKILDGMFLATKKEYFFRYPFDSTVFDGFHGYDIDFCLGHAKHGKAIVVYDILLEHSSFGNFGKDWIDAQEKVTNKWKDQLPLYTPSVSKSGLMAAEIANLEQYLVHLFNNRYSRKLQLKYLFQLLKLRPVSLKNLYFLRKTFVPQFIGSFVKSVVVKQ